MVSGTTGFTATSIPIQPGLISVFQWLGTQTGGWEKYWFKKLRAIYIPRCGSNTTGTVVMAPDYDAADPVPTSEVAATSFHGSSDDAPWKTSWVDFDMQRSKELYLRNGPLAANLDIKTYDFASLYVCTTDATTAGPWGKIILDYTIELYNPQATVAVYAGGSINAGTSGTPANPIGVNPTVVNGSLISSVTGNTVLLQNLIIGQKYNLTVNFVGTGLTALSSTFGTSAVAAIINDLVNAAGTNILDESRFTPINTSDTLFLSCTGTTVTGGYISISPVNTTF